MTRGSVMTERIFMRAPHRHRRGSTSKIFLNNRAHVLRVSLAKSESSPAGGDCVAASAKSCAPLPDVLARLL